ncbi:hypothetical protein [Sphaerotilus sp.]|uniref:hypothetical protein n=1 Tax=Sphaerotilus sp. TaxID=2093942 RepID=UPI0025DC3BA2|nr:hypothetical protein [Sphaerotilus sp.]
MRVLVDANFLIHLIDHREGGTKQNQLRHQKLSWLLSSIVSRRGKIVVPTPALSEYLVNAGAASEGIIQTLTKNRNIVIASFDQRAAHTCAELHRIARLTGGHKRAPLPETADWQKIKVDWQIVAIGKVNGCSQVITNDRDVLTLATTASLPIQRIDDIELPASERQMDLPDIPKAPTTFSLALVTSQRTA